MSEVIMQIEHITKKFPVSNDKVLTACNDINFEVKKGKTIAIVGESGCGKTTLLKMLMNLQRPTEGKIYFHGKDITELKGEELRQHYRQIQMVFQDPTTAFNPKMKIKDIICEPLINFELITGKEVLSRAEKLLEMVELPKEFADRYPHNMSGGQRQRVAIARALALEPEIICCDEATSALDVSVQDTIIKLLVKLQKEKGITYIFICHDMALVSQFAHEICVMYLGNMMEKFEAKNLDKVRHPYTKALLKAVFSTDSEKNKHIEILPRDIPSPLDLPIGCPFQTRCVNCKEDCQKNKPLFREIDSNHFVACHYPLH